MPKTKLGKWCVGLGALFVALFGLFQVLVGSGQRGGETFADNLLLSIPMLLAGASIILAFFLGLVAIVKFRERSPLVFVTSLIGLLALWLVVGEALVPH